MKPLLIHLRVWYRRWDLWRKERKLKQMEEQLRAVYTELIFRWERRNWWRFVPPEGWQIGFNVNSLPAAAHQHFRLHGRFLPITADEVSKATTVPANFIREFYRQHGRQTT